MSFFGFDNNDAIEHDRTAFRNGASSSADEDIAVYNWGTQDYDGLGNALEERGDNFNDETFGSSGPVGKDFDFGGSSLPKQESRPAPSAIQPQPSQPHSSQAADTARKSRDSLWDDKSPFSVLRTSSSIGRRSGSAIGQQQASSSPNLSFANAFGQASQSPSLAYQTHASKSSGVAHMPEQSTTDGMVDYSAPGSRTLAEIEAEMRAQSQKAKETQVKEQERQRQIQEEAQLQMLIREQQRLQEQHAQQHLQQMHLQQQQQVKPPRMRAESPSVSATVYHSSPLPQSQSAYGVMPSDNLNQRQQQQLLLREVENMRIQQERAALRQELAQLPPEIRAQIPAHVDPLEFLLAAKSAHAQAQREREQARLPPNLAQLQQLTGRPMSRHQQRLEELAMDVQEQERRSRSALSDDAMRRQIHLDQQRQAQLAAAGLLDQQQQQRRESPVDQLHHQLRLQMANELASKGQREAAANLLAAGGSNAPDVAQLQQQQRMLAQLAQQEFAKSMGLNGANGANGKPPSVQELKAQEMLRAEAMRKIMEAEHLDGKRRKKAAKIAHMSRYNDLMTQSDKDFITRIQVSQLVTSDPYTEDFYAQVYGSLMRSRMGLSANDERVLKFGSSGEGVGLGLNDRGGGRRPNAMQRMEQQVERIINNARQREKEKGQHAIHNLQGALGKTAGRSYKAAPRQLLQVNSNGSSEQATNDISKGDKEHAAGAAKEAARRGREAMGVTFDANATVRRDPLTRKECLVILERLYDSQLMIEQFRREQPPADDEEKVKDWDEQYKAATERQWDDLRVMVPLEACNPHPFISLLNPAKGKKLLPRIARHLQANQLLQIICLLVACFSQLDVVCNASVLDAQVESPERKEVEAQTELFLGTVLQCILPVISQFNLSVASGMMGLMMEHGDMGLIIHSRPGQALLTAFLSRAEVIKNEMVAGNLAPSDIPTEADLASWQGLTNHLFHLFAPFLLHLFPSSRIPAPSLRTPAGVLSSTADLLDQPTWKFFATFALHADNEQQQVLVTALREKILDNVLAVKQGFVGDDAEQSLKITNVNIFLHALGLDSSQIAV